MRATPSSPTARSSAARRRSSSKASIRTHNVKPEHVIILVIIKHVDYVILYIFVHMHIYIYIYM